MNTLKILLAEEKDVPVILAFIKGLASHVNLLHEVVVAEKDLRETLFGPQRFAEVFIGYSENEPVAYVLFCYNYSTFLGKPGIYIEDLYVKPEFRGNGIGRAMLRHIAKVAKDRGCGKVEWYVTEWNPRAIKFYENLGANPLQGRIIYRLIDEALDTLANEEVL